ncbi:MAG: choice-of-anchor D domain-containing protein [Paludibacter sp.]
MKKLIIIFLLFLLVLQLHAANTLKIGTYQVSPNAEFVVQLVAENTDPFVAFQVDIPIPDGFKYVEGSAQLNASRISGHALSASLVTGNILRLIGYSVGNTAFLGNSGTLVSFSLKSGGVPAIFALILNQPLLGDSQSTNILSGSSNGSVTVLAPNIVLSTSTLEYGRVPLGSSAEQSFQITNTGSIDLTITSLNFNDIQFSTSEVSGFSIAPQASKTISVKFSPTAKGTLSKQLQIGSNDPDMATSILTLNAEGFAVNEIHTGSISGASSTTKTLEFTLNNMETFTGFQFDLNLPQALTYQSGTAQLFRSQDQIVSVNQVNSQTLRVVAFSAGNKNFSGTSGKVLSLDFLLYGTAGFYSIGISNVLIANSNGENIVSDSFGGQLNVTCPSLYSNSQLSFGDVSILSSSTLLQRVYNYGQEPLTINKLQFSNTYFKSNQILPVTVQPYNYIDLPVIFSDTIKGTANGTIKIFSNDPNNNPFVVQLVGNAFIPNYLKINTPNYVPGESKNVAVEVQNEEAFVAMQFDLSYPVGFTPDLNTITLTNRKQDQILAAIALSNTSLRILVYSPGQKPFWGKSGSILNIPFKAESDLMYGAYNLNLSNAMISNTKSENILYGTKNGILNVQTTTNTQHITDNSTIHIYPNPAKDKIFIQSDITISKAEIYSINGQLMQIKAGNDLKTLDVSGLIKGSYTIRLFSDDKAVITRMIMKK